MSEQTPLGEPMPAPEGFVTQAVRCPRCDVEHSPGYPHATVEDCNAALVGTRILNLEAERDRLRETGDRLARAMRGIDSYAAGSGPAPRDRTDKAYEALKAWEALRDV